MFNLIRRISGSVHGTRANRPWNEDATSNAPQFRKRRRDSMDRDRTEEEEAQSSKKRARCALERSDTADTLEDFSHTSSSPPPAHVKPETEEVKEVTQGVNEVELEEKEKTNVAPENVRLPSEETDELAEPAEDAEQANSPPRVDTSSSAKEDAPLALIKDSEKLEDVLVPEENAATTESVEEEKQTEPSTDIVAQEESQPDASLGPAATASI